MGTLAIYNCRKITIAAVNGHAVGVGFTAMQLPFDFRFVWKGAKLAVPFVRRGIAAEGKSTLQFCAVQVIMDPNILTACSSYLLPKLVGHANATALLLTGSTFSPDSPYLQGLYHKSFDKREDVYPAALAFATDLAANTSQVAVAYTKALLAHPGSSIEENHLLDSRIIRMLSVSEDAAEGAASFKERRPTKFTDTLSKGLSDWYPWVSIDECEKGSNTD